MVKAVLIDIDNTLLDFNKCAEKSIEMAFNKYGLKFNEKVFPVFKKINDGLWLDIEKNIITREILHDIRFNKVFGALGIEFDGHIIEKEFLKNLALTAFAVDGAVEITKYLSQKYVLCTASNAFYNQQVNRLTMAGIYPYISKMFISERIGFSKPNAEFFDACINGLNGIDKSQIIMIGDSLTADIYGAKRYGLRTIWFNKEGIKKHVKEADYTVSNLMEIKEIL